MDNVTYEEKNYPDGMCEFTGKYLVSDEFIKSAVPNAVHMHVAQIAKEIGETRFPGYAVSGITVGMHWDEKLRVHWDEKLRVHVVTWAFQVPINSLAMSEEDLLWLT